MIGLLLTLLIGHASATPLPWRRTDAAWRSPTRLEREAVLDAVGWLIHDAQACSAPIVQRARQRVSEVGLQLTEITVADQRVLVMGEGETAWGVGLFAMRCGPASPLVLQAPHPRFDLRTGSIVEQWFLEGDVRAAQWATVHRYQSTDDEIREDEVHPADVAREPGSLFQSVMVALAVADADLRFVQLHGFQDTTNPERRAILSSGERTATLESIGPRVQKVLGGVGVFGASAHGLGGTGNAQGDFLSRWPGRFVHMELSAETRDQLDEDAALRQRLDDALEGAW